MDVFKKKNLSSSKISFSFGESDHFTKGFQRVLEIASFIDRTIGAVFKSLTDLKDIIPSDNVAKFSDILEFVESFNPLSAKARTGTSNEISRFSAKAHTVRSTQIIMKK